MNQSLNKRGLEYLEIDRQEATKEAESKYEEVLETALFKKKRYEYVHHNTGTVPNTVNILTDDGNNGNKDQLSNLTSPMPGLGNGGLPKGGNDDVVRDISGDVIDNWNSPLPV
jgi:hypothetical protein